jgi:hypothetical protein
MRIRKWLVLLVSILFMMLLVSILFMMSVTMPVAQAWSKHAAQITAIAWAHKHCGDEVYKCNRQILTHLNLTGFNEHSRNQWVFVVEGVETKRPNIGYDPLLPSKQAVKWVGGITPDGRVRNGMKLVEVIIFP